MDTYVAYISDNSEFEIIVDAPESQGKNRVAIDDQARPAIGLPPIDTEQWQPDLYDYALSSIGWVRIADWDVAARQCHVARASDMTSASFRALREYLGLPNSWVARYFGVADRRVRKWDQGEARIPVGVSAQMEYLARMTEDFVEKQAAIHARPESWPFEIPRNRRDLEGMVPINNLPLDWWRCVGGRLMDRVPDLWLDWIDLEDEHGSTATQ